MSGTFRPHGVWTALATPFSTDLQVDYDSLRRLVEFQLEEGVDGVLPCGTTGESPTLSWQEHDAVVEATVKAVERGNVPMRSTTKYWVKTEDVSRVKYAVWRNLRVFLHTGESDSQLTNSVRLDNDQLGEFRSSFFCSFDHIITIKALNKNGRLPIDLREVFRFKSGEVNLIIPLRTKNIHIT